MTSPQQSALVFLQALLRQWGLESLDTTVHDMLTAGDSADVIPIKLRDTEPYKKRFAANIARTKAGLPAYSEAEFLATEAQLKNVVRRYVGSGTYDNRDTIDRLITRDVSPQELNERMVRWQDNYLRWGQAERDAWAARGLTPGDAIAAVFDPDVTESTLERKARIYSLGAASVQAYRDDRALDIERLGELADAGATIQRAQEGYRDVAARQEYEGFLARTAGTELTRREQEDAAILEDPAAERKRRKVLDTDEARYAENYVGGIGALGKTRGGDY